MNAFAAAKAIFPAEPLLLEGRALGFGADILARIGSAVAFSERVAAGDERNRLLIVHCHAQERLTNIPRRGDRIRLAVGSFRIDVDQAHLNGGERFFKLTVATVALVGQPLALGTPVNVLLGFPDILASAGETERLEAHGVEGNVTGEDHQVRP